jgi:phosphoglucomutase
MITRLSPLAGRPASSSALIDVAKLVTAYFSAVPDPAIPAKRVAFGTSGHRGSPLDCAFYE